jgi:hypothetical protein
MLNYVSVCTLCHGCAVQDIMEKEVLNADEKATGGRGSLDRLWGNATGAMGNSGSSEPPPDGEDEYEDIYEDGELASPAEKPEFSAAVAAAQEERREQRSELLADDNNDEYEEVDVEKFLSQSTPSSGFAFRNTDRNTEMEAAAAAAGTSSTSSSKGSRGAIGAPPASKFAAQMSGDWNKQVLSEEAKSSSSSSTSSTSSSQLTHDVPQDISASDDAEGQEPLSIDEQVRSSFNDNHHYKTAQFALSRQCSLYQRFWHM